MRIALNNKNKSLLTASGFVIFLLIAYNMAIQLTIEVRDKYNSIEKDMAQISKVPYQRLILKKEIIQIDSIIGNTHKSVNSQEIILNELVTYCKANKLIIREFPKTHSIVDGDFEIETNTITVEGTFKELLKLLYSFEHKRFTGKLSSARFQLNEDLVSHRKYLTLTFYIQNFKTILALGTDANVR